MNIGLIYTSMLVEAVPALKAAMKEKPPAG